MGTQVITMQEDDDIMPRYFERKLDVGKWLIGGMSHDDVKLMYMLCREQIVANLNKIKAKKNEYV